MPHFAGDAFRAMERGNAGRLFEGFAGGSGSGG